MKKSVLVILLISILLITPLAISQEQTQTEEQAKTYSGFNRFIDNVKLAFSGGDSKVRLALEIREKEVDSAIGSIKNQGEDTAIENLERAKEKLQIVQEKVSLDTSEEIKTSVEEITDKINDEENLPDEFEDYLLEEQKTILTAVLTEKTFELCKELAKEDYSAMLKEELCNPETAVEGLEDELKELKNLQKELFVQLMLDIRSCIDDPGTCNCDDVSDMDEKANCEKMIALAVRCEYKDDQEACSQIRSLQPPAESFVPDFLMNLFKEREDMIDYHIEHSEGVPPECWNENTKPECEQYMHLKETRAKCWDKEGNFNYEECGGPKAQEPTMQQSIPQCFDENNNFLEEKCGEITIIRNEEGLINYIVEKEIDNIITEFENKSEQHTIDVNETKGQIDGENWTIDEGEWTISNKAREIKKEMNQINNQIKNITYAAGTGPGGDGGVVVDGDGPGVVTGNGGDNDVDNVVVDGGGNGGYAPGTSGNSPGDNVVVTDDVTVDSGTVDNGRGNGGGGNDVAGVDEGPGEPGVVD